MLNRGESKKGNDKTRTIIDCTLSVLWYVSTPPHPPARINVMKFTVKDERTRRQEKQNTSQRREWQKKRSVNFDTKKDCTKRNERKKE